MVLGWTDLRVHVFICISVYWISAALSQPNQPADLWPAQAPARTIAQTPLVWPATRSLWRVVCQYSCRPSKMLPEQKQNRALMDLKVRWRSFKLSKRTRGSPAARPYRPSTSQITLFPTFDRTKIYHSERYLHKTTTTPLI